MVPQEFISTLSVYPPLWIFLNRLKYSSLPILFVASIFNIWISVPGFSATSTLFFSIGAWCAIHKVLMFQLFKPVFYPSIVLSIVGIVLLYLKIIPLVIFNVVAIPMYMYGMWLLFSGDRIKPLPILTSATMFIYVAHGYIVENPKVWAIAHNILLPSNMFGELISYFSIPLLAVLVLVTIHWLLRKIIPQTMKVICGR